MTGALGLDGWMDTRTADACLYYKLNYEPLKMESGTCIAENINHGQKEWSGHLEHRQQPCHGRVISSLKPGEQRSKFDISP